MRSGQGDDPRLVARLRAEALESRPAFDAAAAVAVIATIRGKATAPGRAGRAWWRTSRSSALMMYGACLGLSLGTAAWLGQERGFGLGLGTPLRGAVVNRLEGAAAPTADLDALPTLDEFGADLTTGIGTVAATVVGLPEWEDLAVADLFGGPAAQVEGDWKTVLKSWTGGSGDLRATSREAVQD